MIKNFFSFLNCCSNINDFSEDDIENTNLRFVRESEITQLKEDELDNPIISKYEKYNLLIKVLIPLIGFFKKILIMIQN